MKTAGRENPNRWARAPRNRAHGAVGQNRSRSIKWAAKQEKFQPQEMCFFLTSTFIERSRKPSFAYLQIIFRNACRRYSGSSKAWYRVERVETAIGAACS